MVSHQFDFDHSKVLLTAQEDLFFINNQLDTEKVSHFHHTLYRLTNLVIAIDTFLCQKENYLGQRLYPQRSEPN